METVLIEVPQCSSKEVVSLVEQMCNNDILSSISMSPNEALNHRPLEIMLLVQSIRKKKRKILREQIRNQYKNVLALGTVVRIIKKQSKEFSSVKKES